MNDRPSSTPVPIVPYVTEPRAGAASREVDLTTGQYAASTASPVSGIASPASPLTSFSRLRFPGVNATRLGRADVGIDRESFNRRAALESGAGPPGDGSRAILAFGEAAAGGPVVLPHTAFRHTDGHRRSVMRCRNRRGHYVGRIVERSVGAGGLRGLERRGQGHRRVDPLPGTGSRRALHAGRPRFVVTTAGGKPQAKRRHTDNRCQTPQSSHCPDTSCSSYIRYQAGSSARGADCPPIIA